MMDWMMFDGRERQFISQFTPGTVGFIYEIEFSNGKKYLGRKALYHTRKLPPLKGAKKKRIVTKESDWKNYNGSFKDKDLRKKIKSGQITLVKRIILAECLDKWSLTYYETYYLFLKNCLLSDEYYNANILGKFYKPKNLQQ